MADVSEVQEAKKWIYTALSTDTDIASAVGTRIYADYNPRILADRVFPYILYGFLAGVDVDALGTARLLSQPLFQVRLVTEGAPTEANKITEKCIDDVLQVASYEASGNYYFSSRREQPVDRSEFDSATGKHYHNLGGLYRLWIGVST